MHCHRMIILVMIDYPSLLLKDHRHSHVASSTTSFRNFPNRKHERERREINHIRASRDSNLKRVVRGRSIGSIQVPLTGGVAQIFQVKVNALVSILGHHSTTPSPRGKNIYEFDQERAEKSAQPMDNHGLFEQFYYLMLLGLKLRRAGFTWSFVPARELPPRPFTVTG